MPYFTIHYTADGQPYIIQKNYGHKPEKEDNSSHWTWHITREGVKHLARINAISPGHLPTYINDDELEDLKAYNMLARVNGERIGNQGLYPSDNPAWRRRVAEQESAEKNQTNPPSRKKKQQTKSTADKPRGIRVDPEHVTIPKVRSETSAGIKKSAQKKPSRQSNPKVAKPEQSTEEQSEGFWAMLRSLFGKR